MSSESDARAIFTSQPSPRGVYGTDPDRVIEAVRHRALKQLTCRDAADGRRLGLVIEGGGMRGSTTAGGALALAHLGLSGLFDDVYATSAGVMNAAYYLARQEDIGISIYFDDLATRAFYNPLRCWKVLDVDYVMEDVVKGRKRLDLDRLHQSPSRFHVAMLDRSTGEGVLVDTRLAKESVYTVLHAALSVPVLYNRPVRVAGRPCMDGGLAIPFPLRHAIADGCTDILVLMSHPADYVQPDYALWQDVLFRTMCARGSAGTWRTYRDYVKVSAQYRDLATGRIPAPAGVNIATVCSEPPFVASLTMDRAALISASAAFGRRTLAVLGATWADWNLGPAGAARLVA
ncbi:MAG TPA: patatin-like phospholipase family protein [Thermoanaerobaculia bacterium]|jgi:predicted patatin/cPLA2 family phospholipase|nr:patatin-like phospholipase family protein [Thermoanaerobaculia bacterium]